MEGMAHGVDDDITPPNLVDCINIRSCYRGEGGDGLTAWEALVSIYLRNAAKSLASFLLRSITTFEGLLR